MTQTHELMPALAVPVLRTPCLARLAAFYREALGFEVVQQVPGVLALLRHGPLRLQLWQYARGHGDCRVALDGREICIFALHARLARRGRPLLREPAPQLKPWGAWEFSLIDLEGNRLVFVQWVLGSGGREAALEPPGQPSRKNA